MPNAFAAHRRVHEVLAMPAPERFDHFDAAIEAFYAAVALDRRKILAGRKLKPLRMAYRRRQLARRRRHRRA